MEIDVDNSGFQMKSPEESANAVFNFIRSVVPDDSGKFLTCEKAPMTF
jgi:hypothetical protein